MAERETDMPIYEFVCNHCEATREALVDYKTQKDLELLCVQCGGAMRSSQVSMFRVISSQSAETNLKTHRRRPKPCGHTHACNCAIKMEKPNPFQKQVDEALGIEEYDLE